MSNPDAPFGLRPFGYLNGAPYTGQVRKYYIPASDANAIFVGAPVKLAGSADPTGRYPSIELGTSLGNWVGVVVGFDPVEGAGASQANSTIHRVASTERYAYVADDPAIIFEIQEDSVGGNIAVGSIGLNGIIVGSGGSTATGLSAVELDSSSVAANAAYDFQILGVSPRAGNEVGSANCVFLVKLNNHQYADSVIGI